jgi:beta-alanine degradation protein BauB
MKIIPMVCIVCFTTSCAAASLDTPAETSQAAQPAGVGMTAGVQVDPVVVSPEVYVTRLENEHVRVLEMTLPPGRRDQVHAHPDEAVLFLNPGRARITLSNGQIVEKEVVEGEVMWNEAWSHQVENIGETMIHAIIVELKNAPPGAQALSHGGADPIEVSGENYRVMAENDRVRIVDLHFRPGERDAMHGHTPYVAYFRTAADLKFAFPDGRTGGRELAAGEVLWSPATIHQVENAGADDARIWIVELKGR